VPKLHFEAASLAAFLHFGIFSRCPICPIFSTNYTFALTAGENKAVFASIGSFSMTAMLFFAISGIWKGNPAHPR
jgi:hypothetical protein